MNAASKIGGRSHPPNGWYNAGSRAEHSSSTVSPPSIICANSHEGASGCEVDSLFAPKQCRAHAATRKRPCRADTNTIGPGVASSNTMPHSGTDTLLSDAMPPAAGDGMQIQGLVPDFGSHFPVHLLVNVTPPPLRSLVSRSLASVPLHRGCLRPARDLGRVLREKKKDRTPCCHHLSCLPPPGGFP